MLAPEQADDENPTAKQAERAPAIYRALALAIDRRRCELGLSMVQLDDLAGLQDGYWAKAVHADAPSGRIAGWAMVQYAMDVLYPDGFELRIRSRAGTKIDAVRHKLLVRWGATMKDPRAARDWGREFGRPSSSKGGKARARKLTRAERKAIARKAARQRWRYKRRPKPIKRAPTTGDAPGG